MSATQQTSTEGNTAPQEARREVRTPDAAEFRARLGAMREDVRFREAAARVRPDAEEPEVRDGLIWGLITEPGDGVAGALVAALGAEEALDLVANGHADHEGAVGDARPAAGALRDARRRWAPRLDTPSHLGALRAAARIGVRLLLPVDPEWPTSTTDLGAHAPLALWLRGDAAAVSGQGVALVGARASSSYGEHVAGELAGELAAEGRVIFSGGAYGIDGTAHRAALRAGGTTVAVLAGGVDRPYPSGHAQLFERIVASGALVSEVACGVAPTKWRFLARNRLISALSAATVVVEAGQRSGSLNTAGHAASLGRPLGAVPGPITSTASAGCHRLLRDYDARCVTSVADVRELLGIATVTPATATEDPDMVRLADALNMRTPRSSLELAQRSGLSRDRVEALLGVLELDGSAVRSERGWRSILH